LLIDYTNTLAYSIKDEIGSPLSAEVIYRVLAEETNCARSFYNEDFDFNGCLKCPLMTIEGVLNLRILSVQFYFNDGAFSQNELLFKETIQKCSTKARPFPSKDSDINAAIEEMKLSAQYMSLTLAGSKNAVYTAYQYLCEVDKERHDSPFDKWTIFDFHMKRMIREKITRELDAMLEFQAERWESIVNVALSQCCQELNVEYLAESATDFSLFDVSFFIYYAYQKLHGM
jgi:hypothetical protein